MEHEDVDLPDSMIGDSFDSYLLEEGSHERIHASAEKAVIAMELEAAMAAEGVSRAELARRMKTSPAAVTRLLNPDETAVTLKTLQKAATALRRVVHIHLGDPAEAGDTTLGTVDKPARAGRRSTVVRKKVEALEDAL